VGRKIFIDGGANIGQSTRSFMSEWPGAKDYEIFCFEPSKGENIRKNLENLKKDFNNVEVLYDAVWIEDGEVVFYDEEKTSSSLVKEKLRGVAGVTVGAIDLSGWIKRTFSENDQILLKLDIEGSEYEVLEKLVEEGVTYMIDKIFVEIHGSKCGKTLEESKNIVDLLHSVGHKLYMWEGDTFKYETYKEEYYNHKILEHLYCNWTKRGFDRVVAERVSNEKGKSV